LWSQSDSGLSRYSDNNVPNLWSRSIRVHA
jgi:hypothetical protein